MNAEQRLTAGLKALAEATAREQAPPRVEAALLAQLDRAQQRAIRWPRRLAWVTAIAATITVAIVLRPRPPQSRPVPATPVAARPATPLAPPPAVAVAATPAKTKLPRKRRPAARLQQTRVEPATPFYPLTPGDDLSLIERGQIVRVRLPGAALAPFGVPMPEHRLPGRLNADVLIGDDGSARGIRLVGFQGR